MESLDDVRTPLIKALAVLDRLLSVAEGNRPEQIHVAVTAHISCGKCNATIWQSGQDWQPCAHFISPSPTANIGLECDRCHEMWAGETILDALRLGWVPINQRVDYYCPDCAHVNRADPVVKCPSGICPNCGSYHFVGQCPANTPVAVGTVPNSNILITNNHDHRISELERRMAEAGMVKMGFVPIVGNAPWREDELALRIRCQEAYLKAERLELEVETLRTEKKEMKAHYLAACRNVAVTDALKEAAERKLAIAVEALKLCASAHDGSHCRDAREALAEIEKVGDGGSTGATVPESVESGGQRPAIVQPPSPLPAAVVVARLKTEKCDYHERDILWANLANERVAVDAALRDANERASRMAQWAGALLLETEIDAEEGLGICRRARAAGISHCAEPK